MSAATCRVVQLPHCHPLQCTQPRGHEGKCTLVVVRDGAP